MKMSNFLFKEKFYPSPPLPIRPLSPFILKGENFFYLPQKFILNYSRLSGKSEICEWFLILQKVNVVFKTVFGFV